MRIGPAIGLESVHVIEMTSIAMFELGYYKQNVVGIGSLSCQEIFHVIKKRPTYRLLPFQGQPTN